MKSPMYYLVVVLLACVCGTAQGQTRLPDTEQRGLIGRANPALAGITKLYVIVEPSDPGPGKDGLVFKDLQDKVEQKLKLSGLRIEPGITLGKGPREHDIPELRVYMEMLKFADSQIYVFRVQTALATKARLPDQKLFFKADVWKSDPVMRVASVPKMPATVTRLILIQAEAFAAAWLAANPSAQPSDPNDAIITPAKKVPQKPTASTPKPTEAQYKYVASKNSRVFHRPDCASAKQINPENLVGYNSRAEAVKAGKRPCRRCKP